MYRNGLNLGPQGCGFHLAHGSKASRGFCLVSELLLGTEFAFSGWFSHSSGKEDLGEERLLKEDDKFGSQNAELEDDGILSGEKICLY